MSILYQFKAYNLYNTLLRIELSFSTYPVIINERFVFFNDSKPIELI